MMLYMPIVILFYKENGLGNNELFLLHGIYSLVIALWEVPSGVIADRWGRISSMQIGTFLGLIGFFLYSISHGFVGFLFAQIALGLGQGFISGADSALLYDSLHQQKKENKYIVIEGKITALGNLAESLAGVLVSVLAFTIYRNYYYIQTIIAGIGFLSSLFLVEAEHFKSLSSNKEFVSSIISTLRGNRKLQSIIYISALFGLSSLTMALYAQIIFDEIELNETWFGYGWTILNLTVALGSYFAGSINKLFKPNTLIIILLVVFSFTFLISGVVLNSYILVFILIFYFARGIVHPVMKYFINELCASNIRATVLSVRSLLIRIVFASVAPVLGVLSKKFSVQYALLLSGIIVIIPGIVFYFRLIKKQ